MILGIDHLVLTVRDPEAAAAFYNRVLGLDVVRFGQGRIALQCGDQKINLQSLGQETRNHAAIGCGDLCLLTDLAPENTVARLTAAGVAKIKAGAPTANIMHPSTNAAQRGQGGPPSAVAATSGRPPGQP